MNHLQTLTAVRYVQPLREGGSLPAIVDTMEAGLYVAKFRGAGQGVKALVAEIIVGLLAREAGLPTPEPALLLIPDSFGRTEPDPEIQDLLRASHGINFGARYLDGAFNFDLNAAADSVTPELAAEIVWFDAFVSNPDRTHRNPNLLVCNRLPYLIDHGAALYAQHDWPSVDDVKTRSPFPLIKDHVLLGSAGDIAAADEKLCVLLTDDVICDVVAAVPDELLAEPAIMVDFSTPDAARTRYAEYLIGRIRSPRSFVDEAREAQRRGENNPARRVHARR